MIKVFKDIEHLSRFAAEKFVEIANEVNERNELCTVALAGGSTPKSLYRLLAGDEYKNKIDWKSVSFFFGDERNVLPDDENSNFRMAQENLFEPLNISDSMIDRWETELADAEKTAARYASTLGMFFRTAPRFDLILLGMGADGHTASLFPFTKALTETEKNAVANPVEKLAATRLTLTFPVINNARNIIFMVKGADKAAALREVLEGEFQPDKYPSQNVKPADGDLLWLVDEEAARLLQ